MLRSGKREQALGKVAEHSCGATYSRWICFGLTRVRIRALHTYLVESKEGEIKWTE